MKNKWEAVKKCKAKYAAKKVCSTGCGRPLKSKIYCSECLIKKSTKQNPKRNKMRWNLIHNGLCYMNCGRKLFSKWLCRKCLNNKNIYYKKKYHADRTKYRTEALKRAHNKNFSGLRDSVIERDKHSCQVCGYSNKIIVHHIDENPKNNTMDNLITLCKICHTVIERMNRTKPNLLHLFPWFHPTVTSQ